MNQKIALQQLHTQIDDRVQSIRSNHADWLCSKGCGNCCQRLAEIPQLSATEWALLQKGLRALPAEQLAEISQRMAALSNQASRPITCPLLDQTTQACPVYAQRPVACRTYGFYVQRDLGLYCQDIESQVANDLLADVVWGNHDAIDQSIAKLGESQALTIWFAQEYPGE